MYLKNAWYVAAWSNEIGRDLVERTICEQPILLYRKENGDPVAIGDMCPHRFAPLSMGKLIGDARPPRAESANGERGKGHPGGVLGAVLVGTPPRAGRKSNACSSGRLSEALRRAATAIAAERWA
jgi:hypothetical protein